MALIAVEGLILAAFAAVAAGEEPPPAIEEIVVRARKRDERLLDTPVSVTAVTTAELEQLGAVRIDDIQIAVPNLQFRSSAIAQAQSIFLRGVGQQDEGLAFDQGVGLYVDGVPLSRSIGLLLNLVDVEQIEVLRGPQGTLFGRNTVGGAINVRTVRPHDEVEGRVWVRAGNFDSVDTQATLNVPIDIGWLEDRLFSRFTFASRNSRGYVKNLERDEYLSDLNDFGFLGALRFTPVEALAIDVRGAWERSHRRGIGGQCSFESEAEPSVLAIARAFYPGFEQSCEAQTPYRVRADTNQLSDLESYGTWVDGVYDLGAISVFDSVSLHSITSWREQRPRYVVDTDFQEFPIIVSSHIGGPDPAGTDGEPAFARQISQEARAQGSAFDERLNVTAGAFFFWDDADDVNGQSGFRYRADGSPGLDIGTSVASLTVDNYSWALFSQASFDVTTWAQLTAGVRYTADQKGLAKREIFPLAETEPRVDASERRTFEDWTPMASLSLTLPDELAPVFLEHAMSYFSYARGFKGGGFNALVGSQVAAGEVATELDPFRPEHVDSFEVGIKSAWAPWADGRVQANLALFHADYRDIQVVQTRSEGLMLLRFVSNAAEATIQGLELETATVPFPDFTIGASLALLDAEYDEFANAENNLTAGSIDRSGESLPNVPDLQAHVSLQYAAAIAGGSRFGGDLVPRLDWYYQSEVHYSGPEIGSLVQPGYNRLDVRLAYELCDGALTIAAWSQNLLDESYFTGGITFANLYGATARFTAPPRMYGGEVAYRF